MEVSVFGSGYVGLVQAAVLADVGHQVICVDVDPQKIAQLQRGIPPIHEPGLSAMLEENLKAKRLHFTSQASDAVAHGKLIFIAVGTPPNEDGSADLQHVLNVARQIASLMEQDCTLVIKSTVPVGTADKVRAEVGATLEIRGKTQLNAWVVSNPEFLKEGSAIADCTRPDRIIVGTQDAAAQAQMAELYAPFNRNHERTLYMDNRSAELVKYAANAMLATRISFMNELANLAERLGVDIEAVRKGIGSDPRIGYHFIYPGCGFGGSCFPKDLNALIHTAEVNGLDPRLLKTVVRINEDQRQVLLRKIKEQFQKARGAASYFSGIVPGGGFAGSCFTKDLTALIHTAEVNGLDPRLLKAVVRINEDQRQVLLRKIKEQFQQARVEAIYFSGMDQGIQILWETGPAEA